MISDGFAAHESLEVLKFCFQNKIILCRLPSHTSHKLQPCDVGVFSALKTAYREQVDLLCRGGANAVRLEHFGSLYNRARKAAMTARNITAGWSKSGMFPWNPDRVLRDIQSPPENHCHHQITAVQPINICEEGDTLQTPITADGLKSLCRQMDKKVVHGMTIPRISSSVSHLQQKRPSWTVSFYIVKTGDFCYRTMKNGFERRNEQKN